MCCYRLIGLQVLSVCVLSAANSALLAQSGNTVRTPVAERRWEEKTQTTYRPQYKTEMRDSVQIYYTPVTQYHWETRWRPFSATGWVYEAVPTVAWQAHTQRVRVPVTSQQYVAETKVVRQPYLALRFTEKELPRAVAAVPRSSVPAASGWRSAATTPSASVARREQLGGILQMESDPPRRGLQMPGSKNLFR